MTLSLIPTMLILGAFFGLIGSGIIFRVTHNMKATALMFASVFAFAMLYTVLRLVQSGNAGQ